MIPPPTATLASGVIILQLPIAALEVGASCASDQHSFMLLQGRFRTLPSTDSRWLSASRSATISQSRDPPNDNVVAWLYCEHVSSQSAGPSFQGSPPLRFTRLTPELHCSVPSIHPSPQLLATLSIAMRIHVSAQPLPSVLLIKNFSPLPTSPSSERQGFCALSALSLLPSSSSKMSPPSEKTPDPLPGNFPRSQCCSVPVPLLQLPALSWASPKFYPFPTDLFSFPCLFLEFGIPSFLKYSSLSLIIKLLR